MRQFHTTLSFDMRAPDWGTPASELYPAAIEMAAFADKIGVTSINLMEHHGSEDGYLPQPFSLCAAMASVTKNIQFSLGAVILPLHDPVMLAEKIFAWPVSSMARFMASTTSGITFLVGQNTWLPWGSSFLMKSPPSQNW